jgi:hypothetical protein
MKQHSDTHWLPIARGPAADKSVEFDDWENAEEIVRKLEQVLAEFSNLA